MFNCASTFRIHATSRPVTLLLAAAALAAGASPLRATTVNSTWTGASSANWSTSANWSPASAFPNDGVNNYNVTINAVATNNPTLDISVTIDSLSLTANATLLTNSGQTLTLATNAFSNAGTVTLLGNGTFGSSTLFFNPAVTSISGGGTILLSSESFSRISGGDITNVNNTIQGAGIISSNITNQGSLVASGGNLTLNGTVDNTAGLVNILANGSLNLSTTLTGGTLSVASGGQILGGGTIFNATLTAVSNLTVASGASTPSFSGSLVNHGNINIAGNGTFGTATLFFANFGTTTLSGGGTITLTDATFSRISSNFTNADNTIQGQGLISSAFINQSLVRAQAGNLTLNNNVDNTAGTLAATANGTLVVNGSVTDGTISIAPGSQLAGIGTLTNVTLSPGSLWSIASGASSPVLAGNFTNQANITLLGNGTFGAATLSLPATGVTFLNGGGTLTLTDSTFSRISSGILVNVNNTIQGAGTISANVTNQNALIATGGNLTLSGQVDNSNGTVSISANGTLILNNVSPGNTLSGGSVSMLPGSQIGGGGILNNATLSGTGAAFGFLTFNNTTLSSGANLSIQSAATLNANGTLANHGTVTILGNGTFGAATLSFPGNTTLTGGGTVVLTNTSFSRMTEAFLTNADNIIRGTGIINTFITNDATILAENGNLTLNAPITNTLGELIASSTGILGITNGVTGGTLLVNTGGQVLGSGSLSNVTLTAASNWTLLSGASSPILTGTFTNQGNITLQGNGTFGPTLLNVAATPVTLNGGGTITLQSTSFSRILGTASSSVTNIDNIIQGTGTISPPLNNQGHIIASGGNLTFQADVSGTGAASVQLGAAMLVHNFTQSSLDNEATFIMTGNGSISQISGIGVLTLNSAHLRLSGNSLTSRQTDLSVSGAFMLDITTNKLILDPPSKSTTFSNIQSEIIAGNIISSGLPHNFGIVVADNAVTHFTTFGGLPVGPGSLLLAPDLLGDSNLDGHVDLADLNTVLTNFGAVNAAWTSGNFDNAPTIDLTDLADVLNNFGQTYAVASDAPPAQIPAPEPASLTLLATATLLLRARHRPSGQS